MIVDRSVIPTGFVGNDCRQNDCRQNDFFGGDVCRMIDSRMIFSGGDLLQND